MPIIISFIIDQEIVPEDAYITSCRVTVKIDQSRPATKEELHIVKETCLSLIHKINKNDLKDTVYKH
jgi:hypothetical protein